MTRHFSAALTLDLIGRQPTMAEMNAFLADTAAGQAHRRR